MKKTILLADDDASVRFVVSKSLSRSGYKVQATDNVQTLIKWVEAGDGDVILTDVHMDQDDVFDFIPDLKRARPDLPIVIMSANSSVGTALKSSQHQVFEYIPKPFDLDAVADTLSRAIGMQQALPQARLTRGAQNDVEKMIGKSVAMQPVFRAISDYMSGNVNVYVFGDTGTGKTLTANVLHSAGRRADTPIIDFEDLRDDTTTVGALGRGDLYVDRVHEMPSERQSLLLRLLERNETRPEAEKFRTLATGSKSLAALHEGGQIRPDLLYHLMAGQVFLPPLAARTEDISNLAEFFLASIPSAAGRKFTQSAFNVLQAHHWSGNVRELRNLIATIPLKFSDTIISDSIVRTALDSQIATAAQQKRQMENVSNLRQAGRALLLQAQTSSDDHTPPYQQALSWVEKPLIEEALKITRGNNLKAAALLGIHRNTLRTKIKTLGIEVSGYS